MESRVPSPQSARRKQGPIVGQRCGEMGLEYHRGGEMGGTEDWADAEDAEVREDLVESLELRLPAHAQGSNRGADAFPVIHL